MTTLPILMERGKVATIHWKTLFWFGGSYQEGVIPICVLRWKGRAVPDVGKCLTMSFQQLHLREKWLIEVSSKDNCGVRIMPSRRQDAEDILSFEIRNKAITSLSKEQEFIDDCLVDFEEIIKWIENFDEASCD